MLKTALPEGISIKVSETHVGVMRAMIIGPRETPYEGNVIQLNI